MKGPHFFEKRKKEMARQQKAKEKADRKAQRKAGIKVEGDEDELLDAGGEDAGTGAEGTGQGDESEGVVATNEVAGADGIQSDLDPRQGQGQGAPSGGQVQPDHAPPGVGVYRGTPGG